MVHQITYEEIAASKYPIETLADGKGDCDLFVYIAASILEAGGVPVVLLYYKDKLHMELAVDLVVNQKIHDSQFTASTAITSPTTSLNLLEANGGKAGVSGNAQLTTKMQPPANSAYEYGAIFDWASSRKHQRTRPQHPNLASIFPVDTAG